MEYITRYKLSKDGAIKEIKVPKIEVLRLIAKLLNRDKEMLRTLAKL